MKIELRLHLKVEARGKRDETIRSHVLLRFPGLSAEARVGERLKRNIL